MTMTITFSEQDIEVLLTAIITSLNDSQRQLENYQKTDPPNSENIQLFTDTSKSLRDLYNKVMNTKWSD